MFFVFAYDEDYEHGGAHLDDCEFIADTLEEAMQWTPTEYWGVVGIYTVQDRQFVQVAEGEISTEYGAIIPEPVRGDPGYVWMPRFPGPPSPPRREVLGYHVTWTTLPKERLKPRIAQRPNSQSALIFAHRPVPQIPGPPLVTGFGADGGSVTMAWTLSPTVEASADSRPTVQEQIAELRGITPETQYTIEIGGQRYLYTPPPAASASISASVFVIDNEVEVEGKRITLQWEGNATVAPPRDSESVLKLLQDISDDHKNSPLAQIFAVAEAQPTTYTCPTCSASLDERDRRADGRIKCWSCDTHL